MIAAAGSEPKIESYLAQVRAALRGLPAPEIDDILRELRSHIVELTSDGMDLEAALHSLGDPVDLAKTYRTDNQMVQAECSGSPLVILQGLRHASRSRLGRFFVTVLYFFGYANVVALLAAAIEKLIVPARTGLWYTPGKIWSLNLVRGGDAPAGAKELLGWWLVPIALVVGWALRYLIDRVAQWWIRRYRRSRAPQAA
jgi:hypothetical protein